MPNPFDLLSSQLDDQADPDDQLRNAIGQGQGKNLVGGPTPPPGGPPPQGGPQALQPPLQPVAPSPAVPGPLAALAGRPGLKPKIKPKPAAVKKKIKPHIKPKAKKPLMPDFGAS